MPAITPELQQKAAFRLRFPCPNDGVQPNANHLNLPLDISRWPIFLGDNSSYSKHKHKNSVC